MEERIVPPESVDDYIPKENKNGHCTGYGSYSISDIQEGDVRELATVPGALENTRDAVNA
jgi:hypothetical protein